MGYRSVPIAAYEKMTDLAVKYINKTKSLQERNSDLKKIAMVAWFVGVIIGSVLRSYV